MSLDDGWGRDSFGPQNMLYVYRPGGERERAYLQTVPGATDEGRLFLHDICTGRRLTYTVEHVNALLSSPDNPDNIKERIVELIPRLSPPQKQWLAEGISEPALAAVREMDLPLAEAIQGWGSHSLVGAGSGNVTPGR